MDIVDVAIIGGGPAGYSAAIYAARFRLSLRLFAETPGGLIITTHLVENWPGIPRISGWDLMQRFQEHLESMQVPVEIERVLDVSRGEDGFFHLKTDGGTEVAARTLILGTGSEHRKLDVPGEKELANKGVSYCATCDAALFKEKVVAIIGGSDSAAKEALLLSEYASKVYILYRGAQIRPEPINAERVAQNPKIEVVPKVNVKEIRGTDRLQSVLLDNGTELPLDGVFIAIGHLPQNELALKLGVEVESNGEIKIDRLAGTNVPGVFAAGDVANNPFKQAITGASEGVAAAFSAYEYVRKAEIQPT
jgi:thioredoxin reductase (NADPH)